MSDIDYRAKALDLLATDIASEDTGIYPQNSNGKPRTEWQDGWNACTMGITKSAMLIGRFIDGLPEQVQDYLLAGNIRIRVRDEEVKLWVICNDLFYWACADGEDLELSDLNDFNQAHKDAPDQGEILWCCRKRKMRPQKPYYEYFSKEEAALFDAAGPEREE